MKPYYKAEPPESIQRLANGKLSKTSSICLNGTPKIMSCPELATKEISVYRKFWHEMGLPPPGKVFDKNV